MPAAVGQLRQGLGQHRLRLRARFQRTVGREQLQSLLGLLPNLFPFLPRFHGLLRFLPRVAGADRSARPRLPLAGAFVQFLLRRFRRGQRLARLAFGLVHAHAAVTQGMKMIPLIGQQTLGLLVALLLDQRHAFFQARTAVTHHRFEVRQLREFPRPRNALDLVGPLAAQPTQALRFDDHQHRILDLDFVRGRFAYFLPRHLIQNGQQLARLLAGRLRASAQFRHAQRLPGNQDLQPFAAVAQRDAACLTDPGQLLLFLSVDDHRLGPARFPRGVLLVCLPQLFAQRLVLLLRGRQRVAQRSRFAIDPLATNAAFLSVATDIALLAVDDKKSAGNPLLWDYPTHG